MSVIGSNILAGASGQGGGYNLTKSLRFRSSASAYLNRTPASAATSRRIMTYSAWVKIGTLGTQRLLYEGYTSVSDLEYFYFNSSDQLEWGAQVNGGTSYGVKTPAVFRDPSAWYHVVCSIDTTQATDTNRVKIYVNGVQQTGLTTFYSGFPAQNTDLEWNNQSSTQVIAWGGHTGYYDGYMAEINMVDGQALTPSSFGETSTTTGVWIPKKYTGTYGTNGFYLPFTDTTSTSTLGTDFSGNSNTWTVNNISLTSGSTYDSMTDVPTLTSVTTANYCVLNPLTNVGIGTVSNGNLQLVTSTNSKTMTGSMALPSTGQYYFEITATDYVTDGGTYLGIVNQSFITTTPTGGSWLGFNTYSATYENGSTTDTNGLTGTNVTNDGDIWCIAVDMTNGKFWIGRSRSGSLTWADGVTPAVNGSGATTLSLPTGTLYPMAYRGGSFNETYNFNFGQQPFAHTPPTGFVALNTYNLPTPTIGATASTQAITYMGATTYSGDSTSNRVITTGGGSDFVWIKRRNSSTNNILFDVIRGAGATLYSNLTNAEVANGSYYVQTFGNTSFTLGTGGDAADNITGGTYVAWNWKANGSGSTNTAGSITSTVSANTTAGFSIVTYTGNGSSPVTIGHGLGVTPAMVILKDRDATSSWMVKHQNMASNKNIFLEGTGGEVTPGNGYIQDLSSTTTFGVINGGSGVANVNTTNNKYVAYCFAPVAGYSAFGTYTGNGDPNGSFVYLGFRPKFVLIKSTASGTNWVLHDSSREPFNEMGTNSIGYALNPENNVGESTNANLWAIDFTSNGFKNRSSSASVNSSGQTYIYMAFAENPFKYSNAR